MLSRRGLLALLALVASAGLAAAAETPFSQEAFAEAQKAGKSIVLHVYAPWCPTCRAQEPILHRLEADPNFAAVVALRVDFDNQKDAVRALKARNQSTIDRLQRRRGGRPLCRRHQRKDDQGSARQGALTWTAGAAGPRLSGRSCSPRCRPASCPCSRCVFGAAAAEHKWAPAALAVGVAGSFVAIGLFVATVGFAIGVDGDALRAVAAAMMVAFGAILACPGVADADCGGGRPLERPAQRGLRRHGRL